MPEGHDSESATLKTISRRRGGRIPHWKALSSSSRGYSSVGRAPGSHVLKQQFQASVLTPSGKPLCAGLSSVAGFSLLPINELVL